MSIIISCSSAGYMSAGDSHKITTKDRDDVPIGLFPQLFELYKWVQQSGIWDYQSRDIIIPDKIYWDTMTGSWENIGVFYNKKYIYLSLTTRFNSPKIGEYILSIKLCASPTEDMDNLNYEFKFTEKDLLDLKLIEKHAEKCQQFCDEMEQVYNDSQRICDEILARYK